MIVGFFLYARGLRSGFLARFVRQAAQLPVSDVPSPQEPVPALFPNKGASELAKKRVSRLSLLSSSLSSSQNVRIIGPGVSLAVAEAKKMELAVSRCVDLLFAFIDECKGAEQFRDKASHGLLAALFQSNFQQASSLNQCRSKFESFLSFIQACGGNPWTPTPMDVARFLVDQAARGPSHSGRAHRALEWASAPFAICFHFDNPLVIAAKNARGHTPVTAAPGAAKSVTVDLVRVMEELTFSAPLVIAAWSGMFAALAHGCLRWADLQRSPNLSLTSDALVGDIAG